MRSISRSVQRTIAQLAWLRGREGAFVCGGTQRCRIKPLAQSQFLPIGVVVSIACWSM
jgi:hypothetical protein